MARRKSPDPTAQPPTSRISRRRFLELAGTSTAAAAWSGSSAGPGAAEAAEPSRWDETADVVVVGGGAAALSAAVSAAAAGAQVIVVEKARSVGGTTARSGGGHWIPNNSWMRAGGMEDPREDALRYMARFSYPHLYDPSDPLLGLSEHAYDLIAAHYDNASDAIDALNDLGALTSMMGRMRNGEPWPDYFDHAPENQAPRGRLLFPQTSSGLQGYGSDLVGQLRAAVERQGTPILVGHRVTRLVTNQRREVIGLEATTGEDQPPVAIRARRAVVFGSGGFTHDRELRLELQRGPVYGGCAAPTNTGDFLRIAGAVGAKLGNLKSAWRQQVVLDLVVKSSDVSATVWQPPGDGMILVSKHGRRVVNEKRCYNDRTEVHFDYDPSREEWRNLVLFMIWDERTADVYAANFPVPAAGQSAAHVLRGGSLEELAAAIDARLESLTSHVGGFRLDPGFAANLAETVERFNGFAETGVDEDFGRGAQAYDRDWHTYQFSLRNPRSKWPANDKPNPTMYPLSTSGPYYAALLAAGTLDTNGGPVIDARAQVLDSWGEPIPGLYGAGNCIASPSGRAYWGGGCTLGLALTFGYLAGRNAASEPAHEGSPPCSSGERRLPARL